jgi:uncharacterized coiled-coil protein SlyX
VRGCLNITVLMLLMMAAWQTGVSPAARADTPSAARVKETAEKTVDIDVGTQQLMEGFASEEQKMLDRIEELSTGLKQARWQLEKNTRYIRSMEDKIADLNQQAADIEEVESALLPILDSTLNRLDTLVRSDLPMSLDHRLETIARTQRILDDYDADLPAKTRAVLDTLNREVDLGHTVGVEEQEIETDGGFRQVKLLRVGRIGLFAVTLDNRTGFAWDRSLDRFIPLEKSARDLMEVVEMAEGIRLIGLRRLPLDLPPAQTNETGPEGNSREGREPTNGGNRAEHN